MNLSITICATKSYCYAMHEQARRVRANITGIPTGHVFLVGDDSKELKQVERLYISLFPKEWAIKRINCVDQDDTHENYKESAQLLIARMRTAAFDAARNVNAERCWSLDSDVLPPHNALRCMNTMLDFDDGWYSVSTCTYPSQSGGGFLGGRGTPHRHILPDFTEEERDLPADLTTEILELREALKEWQAQPWTKADAEDKHEVEWRQKAMDRLQELEKATEEFPPNGNIWTLNGKQWRQRGWLDNAYPGVGLGSVLPSDWCGFGCTLMNSAALNLAHFDGYEGRGTEDLYIVWRRWHPAGLRLNVIPHAPCDHVIRDRRNPGKYIHVISYHEPVGETAGHLRLRHQPFIPMTMPNGDSK